MKLRIYGIREQNNPVSSYYIAQDPATAEESFRSERYLPLGTAVLTDMIGEIDIEEDVLRSLDGRMKSQEPGLVAFFDNGGMSYLRLKVVPLRRIIQP